MNSKVVGVFLALFIGISIVAVHTAQVTASGTIRIGPDGTIDPPTAPIRQNGSVYTLTSNITGPLVLEKDGIVIDGAGYTVRGVGDEKGVELTGRRGITIKNLEIESFEYGIWLTNSTSNLFHGNDISANNVTGFYLRGSSNNSIFGNYLTGNLDGIFLQGCSNNSISGNNITANDWDGIVLSWSSNNILSENVFSGCGLSVLSSYRNSVKGNIVNGKSLVYLEDFSDYTIVDAGQVVLVSCINVTVENLHLSKTSTGVHLWNTTDSIIKNNTITDNQRYGINIGDSSKNSIHGNNLTNNDAGVSLQDSSNNTLFGNSITKNKFKGFSIYSSYNNLFYGNKISANNDCGIYFWDSSNNTIHGNNISANNRNGICFDGSSHNTISGNNIMANLDHGVSLWGSSNNSITGNMFLKDGLAIWDSYGNAVDYNLVNGRPLIYLERAEDLSVEEAGQVVLVNCNNMTLENLNLSYTSIGIQLWRTNNTKIAYNNLEANNYESVYLIRSSENSIIGNNIADSDFGVSLWGSPNNSITGNSITNNNYGVYLFVSLGNVVYHNNFVGNGRQAYSDGRNTWDNGIEGNYWSDYNGTDGNQDGLGNTSYVTGSGDEDNYPLMGTYYRFNTSLGYDVKVISNSTIKLFTYFQSNATIRLYVSNMTANQTSGFCRLAIPHILINVTNMQVIIDNGLTPILHYNHTIHDNGAQRWIYFAYPYSTRQIDILPEYTSPLILFLFIVAAFLIVMHTRITDRIFF